MKKFAIEVAKCAMLTIAISGMAVVAVLLLPLEMYVQMRRKYG